MYIISDLQLHSRFSRAVSPQMTIPNIAAWAQRKGIGLVATGDWTHPMWFREIQRDLEEVGNGLLQVRKSVKSVKSIKSDVEDIEQQFTEPRISNLESPYFLLATEVSCIYSQGGKGRRVHTLIWVPTIESASKINKEMTKQGCNLLSDGRPIIGLTSIQVAELVLAIEPKALIIAAHAWTPWFSLYGSKSGFDSIDEAFGPYAKYIYAVETGLSSNPSMNWRIKELDTRAILSFSDAHSGPKLGREATVFEIPDGKLSYDAIYEAIKNPGAVEGLPFAPHPSIPNTSSPSSFSKEEMTVLEKVRPHALVHPTTPISNLKPRISYTIEFYPEEGKYHYSGHKNCNIRWTPEETKQKGLTCPVCGKSLIEGVMQRVEQLASRSEADLELYKNKENMVYSKAFPNRPPFVMLVPLQEIIAEAIGSPVASPKVAYQYDRLVSAFDNEFSVLLQSSISRISQIAGERIAEGIDKVRRGDIVIDPGYDGVFGVVKIWGEEKVHDPSKEQLSIF